MTYRHVDWDLCTDAERVAYLSILEGRIARRRARILARKRERGCIVKAVCEVCGFPYEFVLRALEEREEVAA